MRVRDTEQKCEAAATINSPLSYSRLQKFFFPPVLPDFVQVALPPPPSVPLMPSHGDARQRGRGGGGGHCCSWLPSYYNRDQLAGCFSQHKKKTHPHPLSKKRGIWNRVARRTISYPFRHPPPKKKDLNLITVLLGPSFDISAKGWVGLLRHFSKITWQSCSGKGETFLEIPGRTHVKVGCILEDGFCPATPPHLPPPPPPQKKR